MISFPYNRTKLDVQCKIIKQWYFVQQYNIQLKRIMITCLIQSSITTHLKYYIPKQESNQYYLG
jgi:hypothetical protein